MRGKKARVTSAERNPSIWLCSFALTISSAVGVGDEEMGVADRRNGLYEVRGSCRIEVNPKPPIRTRDDLSMARTHGDRA
jgi:hypothetical protein